MAIAAISLNLSASAGAATLTTSSVALSDSRPAQTGVTYTHTASGYSATAIKCIKVQLATTATGGTAATGVSITGIALGAGSTLVTSGNFVAPTTSNVSGVATFVDATGHAPGTTSGATLIFSGITNGSTAGTGYFFLVNTYNNSDCATSPIDDNATMFVYVAGQTVSLSVDPSLTFSLSGVSSPTACNSQATTATATNGTIPLGKPTTGANSVAAQTLATSTNAGNGFTVYTRYTAAPTYGSFTIADWTGTNAAPTAFSAAGNEAFGYTTSSTSLSGTAARFSSNKWAKFTTTNAEVDRATGPASNSVCVGVQVGISPTTPSGTYNTTVIYTVTPIF